MVTHLRRIDKIFRTFMRTQLRNGDTIGGQAVKSRGRGG